MRSATSVWQWFITRRDDELNPIPPSLGLFVSTHRTLRRILLSLTVIGRNWTKRLRGLIGPTDKRTRTSGTSNPRKRIRSRRTSRMIPALRPFYAR